MLARSHVTIANMIKKVTLRDIGRDHTITLENLRQFNYFIGGNGIGKSTILKVIGSRHTIGEERFSLIHGRYSASLIEADGDVVYDDAYTLYDRSWCRTFSTWLEDRPDAAKAVVEDLRKVLPYVASLEKVGHRLVACHTVDGGDYILESEYPDTVAKVLHVLMCVHSKGNFACIDAPEDGLHPLAQEKLRDLIRLRAEETGKQVFIATHSPYILGSKTDEVFAFLRDKDGKVYVNCPKPDEE